jgi:ribosomal protein L16/L10AE
MAFYLVRVELHNAAWPDDYNVLHKAMHDAGFDHRLRADDGNYYRLPTAEYSIISNNAIENVRQAANQAAAKTGRSAEILFVAFTQWSSTGLTPD